MLHDTFEAPSDDQGATGPQPLFCSSLQTRGIGFNDSSESSVHVPAWYRAISIWSMSRAVTISSKLSSNMCCLHALTALLARIEERCVHALATPRAARRWSVLLNWCILLSHSSCTLPTTASFLNAVKLFTTRRNTADSHRFSTLHQQSEFKSNHPSELHYLPDDLKTYHPSMSCMNTISP